MSELKPIIQTKLFGLEKYLNDLIKLENLDKLPSKILFSGQKGIGKSTLAYHFINYVLSKDENLRYDSANFKINSENSISLQLEKTEPDDAKITKPNLFLKLWRYSP